MATLLPQKPPCLGDAIWLCRYQTPRHILVVNLPKWAFIEDILHPRALTGNERRPFSCGASECGKRGRWRGGSSLLTGALWKNLRVRWRHLRLHDRKLVFCLRVLHQRQPGTGPGKWMAACLSELIPVIFHNVGLLRLRMQHEGDAAWKEGTRNSYGGAVGLKQWFNFARGTPEEAAETLTVMRHICLSGNIWTLPLMLAMDWMKGFHPVLGTYFTYPSVKEPIERIFKGETTLATQLDEPL